MAGMWGGWSFSPRNPGGGKGRGIGVGWDVCVGGGASLASKSWGQQGQSLSSLSGGALRLVHNTWLTVGPLGDCSCYETCGAFLYCLLFHYGSQGRFTIASFKFTFSRETNFNRSPWTGEKFILLFIDYIHFPISSQRSFLRYPHHIVLRYAWEE